MIGCVLCKKPLENCDPEGNQPMGGTEFATFGHYGSAVTDHMDGTGYAINVCDPCLRDAGRAGLVLRIYPPEPQPRARQTYRMWRL